MIVRALLAVMLCLLAVNVSAAEVCAQPAKDVSRKIKELTLKDLQEWQQEAGDMTALSLKNITIAQAYQKDSFVIAEHRLDCCFEGFIGLYKVRSDGTLTQIDSYNGYDEKGVFVGFKPASVRKHFKKSLPRGVASFVQCWK